MFNGENSKLGYLKSGEYSANDVKQAYSCSLPSNATSNIELEDGSIIKNNHTYSVMNYDEVTNVVTIVDPQNTAGKSYQISLAEFSKVFDITTTSTQVYDVNEVKFAVGDVSIKPTVPPTDNQIVVNETLDINKAIAENMKIVDDGIKALREEVNAAGYETKQAEVIEKPAVVNGVDIADKATPTDEMKAAQSEVLSNPTVVGGIDLESNITNGITKDFDVALSELAVRNNTNCFIIFSNTYTTFKKLCSN
jgi:hypothetical protein